MPMKKECEVAGVSVQDIERIARNISRYARELKAMGAVVFGGTDPSIQIWVPEVGGDRVVLAELHGSFDGGDNTIMADVDGLMRST